MPCLALSFLALALTSDSSRSVGVGGTVGPFESPHIFIRLIEQTIRIKLPEGKVRAEYTFHNEGPTTTATMIFPENGYRAEETPGYRKGAKSQFGYFRIWLDRKPTTASLEPIPPPTGYEGYLTWRTKTVAFRANQTRKVVNEYQGGFEYGPPLTSKRGFSYMLQTGKSWKGGRIGRTVAVIDARDVWQNSPVTLTPRGWTGWKGYYTWERRDYVPSEDLSAHWYDGYLRFFVNDVSAVKLLELDEDADSRVMPEQKEKEIYIPVRMAAQALGATFLENPMRLETHIKKVEISEVPGAYVKQGRTMVPLRYVANKLGGRYAWYEDGLRIVMPPKPEPPK